MDASFNPIHLPAASLIQDTAALAKVELRPLVAQIDQEGLYPEAFLRTLGAIGGFASIGSEAQGGTALGLGTQIRTLATVGAECGSTAFLGWCQSACGWYLRQTPNAAVRERYLPQVMRATALAGTGMSNTVKHLSGIEKHLLQARPEGEGFVVNGSLPWVSNLGESHVFAASAQLPDGRYIMFMARGDAAGVTLNPCPEFCALEGTRTLNVRFVDVRIEQADLLADAEQFEDFICSIKPGFILLQIGMGAGVIEACLKTIRDSNLATPKPNAYLDDQYDTLRAELDALLLRTQELADQADAGTVAMLPVLEVRLAASELALRAAQSAALHAGAKGYLMRHAAQRHSREALFVAIVTPAIKHLRLEIERLRAQG